MSSSTRASERGPDDAPERSCPSARCEPGATLLGIVNGDGTVGYITPPLQIDDQFVQRVKQGRDPEKRFRFAGTCVEGGCKQWTGSRCGVIDRVLAAGVAPAAPAGEDAGARASLPQCAIRSTCRWFAQSGADACRVCPLIATDLTESRAETADARQMNPT
jgi:hypothetical protein